MVGHLRASPEPQLSPSGALLAESASLLAKSFLILKASLSASQPSSTFGDDWQLPN